MDESPALQRVPHGRAALDVPGNLLENAEFQALSQIFWIQSCILLKSPGDSCAQSSLGSTGVEGPLAYSTLHLIISKYLCMKKIKQNPLKEL